MAAFNKFQCFSEHLAEKIHNLDTDTLKVYLVSGANTPNPATHTVKADLPEITAQNGYPSGGTDIQNATSRSGATTSITGVDVVWTATGTVGPFQYVVLYNDTPAVAPVDPLIGWWDYGSNIQLANAETFTVDFGTSVLQIT